MQFIRILTFAGLQFFQILQRVRRGLRGILGLPGGFRSLVGSCLRVKQSLICRCFLRFGVLHSLVRGFRGSCGSLFSLLSLCFNPVGFLHSLFGLRYLIGIFTQILYILLIERIGIDFVLVSIWIARNHVLALILLPHNGNDSLTSIGSILFHPEVKILFNLFAVGIRSGNHAIMGA